MVKGVKIITVRACFMILFQKLLFSDIFTLVLLYFFPFMIHDIHQDQDKDNIFHCICEYKTKQLILSMNPHYSHQNQSPSHIDSMTCIYYIIHHLSHPFQSLLLLGLSINKDLKDRQSSCLHNLENMDDSMLK